MEPDLAGAGVAAPAPAEEAQAWGIVGYRRFTDRGRFERELARLVALRGPPGLVVSGGAPGADTLAREWAAAQGIPFVEHAPAAFGRKALLARNTLIVRDSALIVAFLSQQSRGTHDTLNKARRAGRAVVVIPVD